MNQHVPIPACQKIRQYIVGLIQKSGGEPVRLRTERELSELFQVTRGTVRQALKAFIDNGTLVARHGMGTFVNPEVLSAPRFCKHKVGIICGSGTNVLILPHTMELLAGVFKGLAGLRETTAAEVINFSSSNLVREIELLNLDGVIWLDADSKGTLDCRNELDAKGFPMITTNKDGGGRCYVDMDYSTGAEAAVRYLRAQGHESLAFVGDPREAFSVQREYEAFMAAADGLGADESRCVLIDKVRDIPAKMDEFIKNAVKPALYSIGGEFFHALLRCVDEKKISVPGDCGMVIPDYPAPDGYGHIIEKAGITGFRHEKRIAAGEAAARAIAEIIQGQRSGFNLRLEAEILN